MIVGDAHWQWHVDQLVAIYEDFAQTASESGVAPDAATLDLAGILELRRRGFVGDGFFGGCEEAWVAACREARRRAKVVYLRASI